MPSLPSIQAQCHKLQTLYGLTPVMGVEIEWYVRSPKESPELNNETYVTALDTWIQKQTGLPPLHIEIERGHQQFEASLPHTHDLELLIQDFKQLKKAMTAHAPTIGCMADFRAKPYKQDYGNGLHVHIHLEDKNGKNQYWKQEEELSPALEKSLAGILDSLPSMMSVFAPTKDSWLRFKPGFHAPVKFCWGTNNRTVALRLPDQCEGNAPNYFRRIEHRVAGSDAKLEDVICAILHGVLLGFEKPLRLSQPVFGDAGNEQYDYPVIEI